MTQVSPDGQWAVTTLNEELHTVNFRDYRFIQTFYPTRGILGWYNRKTGKMGALPGADDPRYVQTNAVWSPDGKYLVFARAEARESYRGPPAGCVCRRSERDADPVRSLPDSFQRRKRRQGGADRGSLAKRHEQFVPQGFA